MASSSNDHYSAPTKSTTEDGKGRVNLPLGYHFCPSDDEMIHCLKQKILGRKLPAAERIPTIDLYSCNPDQIPLEDYEYAIDGEWYYFTRRPEGDIVVKDGYWKPTSSDMVEIQHGGQVIGYKQTIPFFWGVPPDGKKSNWLIHEYRVNPDTFEACKLDYDIKEKVQNFVICRVTVINKSLEARIKNRQQKKLKLILESLGIFEDEEDVKTDASDEVHDDNSIEENNNCQNIGDDVKKLD